MQKYLWSHIQAKGKFTEAWVYLQKVITKKIIIDIGLYLHSNYDKMYGGVIQNNTNYP